MLAPQLASIFEIPVYTDGVYRCVSKVIQLVPVEVALLQHLSCENEGG